MRREGVIQLVLSKPQEEEGQKFPEGGDVEDGREGKGDRAD